MNPLTQTDIYTSNDKENERVGLQIHFGEKRAVHGRRQEKEKIKPQNGLILSHTRLREVEKLEEEKIPPPRRHREMILQLLLFFPPHVSPVVTWRFTPSDPNVPHRRQTLSFRQRRVRFHHLFFSARLQTPSDSGGRIRVFVSWLAVTGARREVEDSSPVTVRDSHKPRLFYFKRSLNAAARGIRVL